MNKNWVIWIIALLVTYGSIKYQRLTGPTYPKKVEVVVNGAEYELELPRSAENHLDAEIKLEIDQNLEASLFYHRYPVDEEYIEVPFEKVDDGLIAVLPKQPMAGKLIYFIEIKSGNDVYKLPDNQEIVVRFKGYVPRYFLVPHVLFMILAMLFSNVAGLYVLFRKEKYKLIMYLALATLIIGGMILGPAVQKYAFGAWWTGIPFGWDLTDNKTLFALIFWLIAFFMNIKKRRPKLILVAAIVTLIIYLIPHSMFGSELDYATGTVIQG